MLNELLKKQRDKLLLEVEIKTDLNKSKVDIEKELNRLEKEFSECEKELRKKYKEFMELENLKKKSPFKFFIKEKFSKKYRSNITFIKDELRKYRDNIQILHSKMKSKDEESKNIKEKLVYIKAKEKELSLLENEDYAIKKLLNNDSTILDNDEVMIDLIVRNMEYICLDKNNSQKVYFYLIDKVLKIILQKIADFNYEKDIIARNINLYDENEKNTKINQMQKYDTWIRVYEVYRDNLLFMSKELRTPKIAPNGKYKIPHKFLFEAIRKEIMFVKDQSYKFGRNFNEEIIALAISRMCGKYKEMDCKLSISFANKIEGLYTDESTDLYLYDTNSLNEKLVNKIFRDGLFIKKEYNCCLNRITIGQYQNKANYFTFLDAGNSDKILLSIPKDENSILGNNSLDGNMYILPKYVIGEIKNDFGKPVFVENDVPLDKRTVYDNVSVAIGNKEEDEISISKHV